jgi:hypothetical protein
MSLKKVVTLNEGPMDYLRGAAQRIAPAIRQVHQAGKQSSLNANFQKALAQLVQMIKQVQPSAQPAAPKAKPAAPSYNANPGVSTATPNSNGKPAPTNMPLSQRQYTFASYIVDTMADQLNEGPMDFLRGAAGALGGKITDKVNQYAAGGKSMLRDVVAAGNARSEEGDAQRQNQQLQQQVTLVKQLIQKLGLNRNQALRAIADATKPAGVNGNYVAKLLGLAVAAPSATPPAAPPAPAPAARSSQQPAPPMRAPNPTGRRGYR